MSPCPTNFRTSKLVERNSTSASAVSRDSVNRMARSPSLIPSVSASRMRAFENFGWSPSNASAFRIASRTLGSATIRWLAFEAPEERAASRWRSK